MECVAQIRHTIYINSRSRKESLKAGPSGHKKSL